MKTNTKLLLSGLLACGSVLIACGDSGNTGGAGGTTGNTATATVSGPSTTTTTKAATTNAATTTNASSGSGGGFPTPPTLGTQLDRMGRPAINTALDETFVAVNSGTPTASTTALRDAAEATYNGDAVPAHWLATYIPSAAQQLAVLDALDAADTAVPKGCGNQAAAGGSTAAGAYNTLATVFVADTLWVSSKTTATCTTYLGLELKAAGLNPALDDCGGRRPADDVIATTYGALSGAGAFDDGIVDTGHHQATFPFLTAPQ